MSKFVKQLVTDHLRSELDGVEDALLVDVVGLEANANNRLRTELSEKNIKLRVVKNSLARRATEGTPLEPAFEGINESCAVVWGGEDFVSLTKEVVRLVEDKQFQPARARGGVMDGEQMSAEQVKEVSRWPNRAEQLSLLLGQILSPGSTISGQLLGPGGALASQVEQKADGEEA